MDSTGDTVNGHEAKKAKMDIQVDEKTPIDCVTPQTLVR